jgi:hypothetical protein
MDEDNKNVRNVKLDTEQTPNMSGQIGKHGDFEDGSDHARSESNDHKVEERGQATSQLDEKGGAGPCIERLGLANEGFVNVFAVFRAEFPGRTDHGALMARGYGTLLAAVDGLHVGVVNTPRLGSVDHDPSLNSRRLLC